MATIIQNLKKDFSGYFFSRFVYYCLSINKLTSTGLMKVFLHLLRVKIGKKSTFRGISVFRRFPGSSMHFGDNCSFVSNTGYNLAGINHKCVISTITKDARLVVGNRVGISGAVISAANFIEIGNNVLIGANVFITDHDWHNVKPDLRFQRCHSSAVVKIEDNVWLGLNAVVLKGVTIGKNTVIGANSVVTKDMPANVLAAGNPCKVIKAI